MIRLVSALIAIMATAVMVVTAVWALQGEAAANTVLNTSLGAVGSFVHWAAEFLVIGLRRLS